MWALNFKGIYHDNEYTGVFVVMTDDLLVDVDGVLADINTPLLRIMSRITGRELSIEDSKEWDLFKLLDVAERDKLFEELSVPGFAGTLKPYDGAQEFIWELRRLGNVYIVTAPFPPSMTWASDRSKWVQDHFDIPGHKVVSTHAKYMVKGRMLLDDNPEHVEKWVSRHPGELGLLRSHTNTSSHSYPNRVDSWEEALGKVKAHLHA